MQAKDLLPILEDFPELSLQNRKNLLEKVQFDCEEFTWSELDLFEEYVQETS